MDASIQHFAQATQLPHFFVPSQATMDSVFQYLQMLRNND